jgi:methylamine---glutamate N-methyltransferase subunit B
MTAATGEGAALEIVATDRPIRDINRDIRAALADGQRVVVRDPAARHSLGVALLTPGVVEFDGSVGYYCGGMGDGATIHVRGSAGWGLAEGQLSGTVVVDGNAGNSAAASIRGGTVVVRGDCAARAGVAMKGGRLLVAGDAGYMTGFMMQKGYIAIAGNAGDALADSMYEGTVYVVGEIASLGNDTVVEPASEEEQAMLEAAFAEYDLPRPGPFKRIVAGRKLWNFEKHELETWRAAL